MTCSFDVAVVGGGHAGVEAAAAASRLGARAALVTLRASDIGVMSCNPAIGGLGRGHLVREIDALDGLIGRAIDAGGIQFRLLNRSKGPAVRGPRAQADRLLFAAAMRSLVSQLDGVEVIEGEAAGLTFDGARRVTGLALASGALLRARAVVLTTGTFLRGVIHRGGERWTAGRLESPASLALAASLEKLDLRIGRLKTGTPPRLRGSTIDFEGLDEQPGDDEPTPLSFLTASLDRPQTPCHLTRTNAAAHAIIRGGLERSPAFSGAISGTAVRYCPSIEDKVVRFADRQSHQVFLEPEGENREIYYPNGVSTALPTDAQLAMIRSMPGLERAELTQFGYAIEYDFVDPRQLDRRLAVRGAEGLFLAGQINGTTGYEEAAAQGLIAGANAALLAGGGGSFELDRAQAYIGVLIDDLTRLGVDEPYRMFTSRAEHRLRLRADNADARLTALGAERGLVGSERAERHLEKLAATERAAALLHRLRASPSAARARGIEVRSDGVVRSAFELLSLPNVEWSDVVRLWSELGAVPEAIAESLTIDARYAPFLARQEADVAMMRREEEFGLPETLDFAAITGLSSEAREALAAARPATIGQASRVRGVTPAALLALYKHARRA